MTDGAQPYTARPALLRGPGERFPAWACACPVTRKQKHAEPWQCITDAELAAWLRYHADVITAPKTARALMWLDLQFARR